MNTFDAAEDSVETPNDVVHAAVQVVNSLAFVNTATDSLGAADTEGSAVNSLNSVNIATDSLGTAYKAVEAVDEVDAVHPRLSQGAGRRRRSSQPAFVCDTCCRHTAGWQDCADHAYRSGHGLAARCALCRLPAIRCRRRGRPGVWHRCVVVDTVKRLGARNVAALVAGSHLTAPRPWRLSCGECGAAFAAKTARLVRHVVERGHSVHRHCERCLFPVFVFGLNDERRELHVCVVNSVWVRAEEAVLLATAADRDTAVTTQLNGGVRSEEVGDGRERSGEISNDHSRRHPSHLTHAGLMQHNDDPNGSITHCGEDLASDFHHHHHQSAFKTVNSNVSGHDHGHRNGGSVQMSNNGEISGMGDSTGSAESRDSGRLRPLTSTGADRWPEERTPSCVAI